MNPKHTILFDAISTAPKERIDAVWGILKYQEIGIFRKLKSIADCLRIDFDGLLREIPTKDEKGRVLDHDTRHLIHDILIQYSK